nr:hypothetical protein [Candidatus Gracilibacteria bacterium]
MNSSRKKPGLEELNLLFTPEGVNVRVLEERRGIASRILDNLSGRHSHAKRVGENRIKFYSKNYGGEFKGKKEDRTFIIKCDGLIGKFLPIVRDVYFSKNNSLAHYISSNDRKNMVNELGEVLPKGSLIFIKGKTITNQNEIDELAAKNKALSEASKEQTKTKLLIKDIKPRNGLEVEFHPIEGDVKTFSLSLIDAGYLIRACLGSVGVKTIIEL